MPEPVFLSVTAHISKLLYRKLGTLLGTAEDFAQQVVLWSLEALPAYQPGRPLEGYLLTNARNRAINHYRNTVSRSDPPCRSCHEGTPCTEVGHCRPYAKWLERNTAKAKLSRPVGLDPAKDMVTESTTVEDAAAAAEMSSLIDAELPVALRADYLRMLAGEPVAKPYRERVQRAVADILTAAGVDVPE